MGKKYVGKVNSLKLMYRKLKFEDLLCEEWEDNPPLFYKWAKENGYSIRKEIFRINQAEKYCPKNSYFESKEEEKDRIQKDGSKTFVNYNQRLECWICSTYKNKKHYIIGIYNTRLGALFCQWAYCIANGLDEPEFRLKRKSNQG